MRKMELQPPDYSLILWTIFSFVSLFVLASLVYKFLTSRNNNLKRIEDEADAFKKTLDYQE